MPQAIEQALQSEAGKKGLSGQATKRYVFGTMNKRGYMRGNKAIKGIPVGKFKRYTAGASPIVPKL